MLSMSSGPEGTGRDLCSSGILALIETIFNPSVFLSNPEFKIVSSVFGAWLLLEVDSRVSTLNTIPLMIPLLSWY